MSDPKPPKRRLKKDDLKTFSRLLVFARPYWWRLAVGAVTSALGGGSIIAMFVVAQQLLSFLVDNHQLMDDDPAPPAIEQVVLTKEMFVFRVKNLSVWSPFYLFWTLCLQAVREEWRRITLMQTNREDCGDRYREIVLPNPPSRKWAEDHEASFRDYFTTVAKAKTVFLDSVSRSRIPLIASASGTTTADSEDTPE